MVTIILKSRSLFVQERTMTSVKKIFPGVRFDRMKIDSGPEYSDSLLISGKITVSEGKSFLFGSKVRATGHPDEWCSGPVKILFRKDRKDEGTQFLITWNRGKDGEPYGTYIPTGLTEKFLAEL